MARGKPALWSALLGVPFVSAGAWLYMAQAEYPPSVGLPFIVFGGFVVLIGIYTQVVVAPDAPRMRDGEDVVATRHPTQRVATAKIAIGFPLLVLTVYLLYFTYLPYVYPTASLVVGLFFFSTGMYTYWVNSLTTYYITTDRVLREYRFLSLVRQELPLSKVRGVQERKSPTEALVGLGNVQVASGDGGSLKLRMTNIEHSSKFADRLRELI